MENTVELYHEFLTQMESTDYSDNQIQLEPIVSMDIEGKERETEGDRGCHKHSDHKHSDEHRYSDHKHNNIHKHGDHKHNNIHKHTDHKHNINHKHNNIHKHTDHKNNINHKHTDHKDNINHKHNTNTNTNPPQDPPSPSSPSSPSLFPKPQMPLFSNSQSCLSIDLPSSLAPSDSNEFVNMKDFEISLDLDQFDITLDDNVSVISYESDNPVVPGLFPKMNINDDDQFLKFDALPLNPSYISK